MGWLQNIFRNDRKLEEIEIDELRLLKEKSMELRTLLEDIAGIMETAIRDRIEKTEATKHGRQPMNILLPSHNGELMKKIRLVEKNLEEEIELTRDIEKKRGEQ